MSFSKLPMAAESSPQCCVASLSVMLRSAYTTLVNRGMHLDLKIIFVAMQALLTSAETDAT